MRTEAATRPTPQDATQDAQPASGRRMKAARAESPEVELARSLTDALEHILRDETRRSA